MAKTLLDLKNFRHHKSDKDSTTLIHKSDGHKIILAHKSLSPESQAQLKMLTPVSQQAQTPIQTNEMRDTRMADGGPVDATPADKTKEAPKEQPASVDVPYDPEVETYKSHISDTIGKYLKSGFHKAAESMGYDEGGKVKSQATQIAEKYRVPGQIAPAATEQPTPTPTPTPTPPPPAVSKPQPKAGFIITTEDLSDPDSKPTVEEKAEGGKVRSLPEILERIKNAYAQGGEVAIRKMYAEGDQVAPPGIAAPPPDVGGVQPTLRGEFNPNTPTSSPEEVKRMKVFDEYNRQAPGPAFQFGPNGEPPQRGVNTKVLEDVSGKVAQEDRYQAEEAKEAQQSVDQANTTLAKYNLPLQNQPSGLPTTSAPGQTGLPTLDQPPMQGQPADAGQPTPVPKQDDMGMGNFQNMMQQGMNEQLQGIKAGQQAATQTGAEAAQSLKQDADNRQQAMSAFQHNFQQLEGERQAHIQDIQNGYIDPDQYWNNHSKVAAGIGMILAGFNPTSHPNAAINFLQSQLDRNMQAQAQNLGAKNNLLAANLHQFGNLRDAQDMTRVMQNDAVQHQLQLASANAASPAAKAAALNASGQLKIQMAPIMQNFALRRAVMGLANGGGSPQSTDKLIQTMMMYNPEEGKMLNAAYVPGVGISRSLAPVPEADRQQILAMNVLDNKGKDLLQFAQAHKNDFSPNTIKVGAQKAAEMVNYYNQSIGGGVLTEGRIKWLDDQISRHPTSVFQDILGNNAQLQEIINSNANRRNMLLQKNNIPVPNQSQPQQPKIKTYGGHKYMRGPNGEPVRVD